MAFDKAKLMTWTASEIENIILKRPRLGLAILQMLVQRAMDFGQRIKTLSLGNMAYRLAWSLTRFSERLGVLEDDGAVRMVLSIPVHCEALPVPSDRSGCLPSNLAEDMIRVTGTLSHTDRRAAAQIRQRKSSDTIAAIRGPKQRKQRRVLGYWKKRAVAKRKSYWREIESNAKQTA